MSKRKVACFVIFGAASVTLAGYSAFAQRTNRALLAEQATADFAEPQISNRAAKTNRLLIQTAFEAIARPAGLCAGLGRSEYDVRAPGQSGDRRNARDPRADARPCHRTEIRVRDARAAAARKNETIAATAAGPAGSQSGLLDDGQISGLKGRLRLTSDQVEYWPAVEAALRDVVRTQLRGTKHAVGGKVNIDTNSPEVQKLIWAAMPLLMRLRDDQKSEVRKLARVIGLEQVASQI